MTRGMTHLCTPRTGPGPTAAPSESAAPVPWTGKTSLSGPASRSPARGSTSRTRAITSWRASVVVYAVAEPAPPGRQSGPVRSAPAAALRLRFAGGPDDVEAIYVSPRDSALYLVSKGRRGVIQLYRVPRNAWGGDTVVTASPLQRLPIPPFARLGRLVTGAAIRPDGRLVAIRTYAEIYTFVPGEGGRLVPSGRPVCNITGLEVQGEAIDFLDDSTFVLTSEADRRGRGSIHTVRCPE